MTEILYGRYPVLELLKANRRAISKIELAKGQKESAVIKEIQQLASDHNISIFEQPRRDLDKVRDHNQGVLAYCSNYPYIEFDEIIERTPERPHPTTILLLDVMQDPQNLGTLLRTAEAVGVAGVVIPKHRAVLLIASIKVVGIV